MRTIFLLVLFSAAGIAISIAVCVNCETCPPPSVASDGSCEVVHPE